MENSNRPAHEGDLAKTEGVRPLSAELEEFKVWFNARFQEFEHRIEQMLLASEARIVASHNRLAESFGVRTGAEKPEAEPRPRRKPN